MKIGIIGLGSRSTAYVKNLLSGDYEGEITCVCDCDEERLRNYTTFFKLGEDVAKFTDYRALLTSGLCEAVIITTPDYTHKDIALCAMDAGLHVLLEKPIDVTLDRISAIYERGKSYDRTLMMGFELRFAPLYDTIRSIVASGELGEIVTLEACERVGTAHAAAFMRRWHRELKHSGGFMNTKCCHDMDLLRYIIGCDPCEVVAFGDRRVFTPKDGATDHCKDCRYQSECTYAFNYDRYGEPDNFNCQKDTCAYNTYKELIDNEIMLFRFANGVTAHFELVAFSGRATRLMTVNGTKAQLDADLSKGEIVVTPLGGEPRIVPLNVMGDGHGGGDTLLLSAFIDSCVSGKNVNNVYDGMMATKMALAGEKSMNEHCIVSIRNI